MDRGSAWARLVLTRLVIAAVTAPLSGCVLNRAADREVADTIARFARERTQAGESYARGTRLAPQATTRPAASAEGTRPEPASLREYIVLALEQNPEIRAAEEMARMRAARVPQATALPDPMVMTRTLPQPNEFADGSNYFTLGVQQVLPVPEKLDRAGRVALQEARMALQELQRARLNVIADVKRAYFRLYIVDRMIEVDRTNQDLLRGLIDAARAQVASGRRRQDDVLRAQVELSNIESQLVELQQERVTTAAMLNQVLSRPPGAAVAPLEEFDVRSAELQLDALIAAAAERSPDLQRLREQLERDRQAVELARLAYWPDFTVGFEWMYMRPRAAFVPPPDPTTGMTPMIDRMSEAGTDSWAILFGANMPVWIEKIEAGIREARSRLAASQHEYAAARNRVSFEIEDALARVRAQQELAAIFGSTIVPQAQQAYEVSRAAYSAGESDFLFVIDNWQKWLMFTIQYHRALGELERGIADLEAAIGVSLEDVGGRS
jgi:outer membrane protein TolC